VGRQRNGGSSIYFGRDGYWHGRVTVGVTDDGRSDRRHVMSKRKSRVIEGVRALEKARESGSVRRAGENWTVEEWLTHWVETIAAASVRDNTLAGYRVAVYRHLIPGLGRHRLSTLRPEHLERLYARMLRTPTKAGTFTKPATVNQTHRTLRTALNEAVRRGYASGNPARLAKAPRVVEEEIEPYTVEEVRRLVEAAMEARNAARWAIALALGLRQGEALGLKWTDVDFEARALVVRRSRLRPKYEHGCKARCGRRYAGHCPDRHEVRPETDETKSRAGRRVVGLPDALCDLLREHKAQQDRERLRAGQLWQDGGWLFATEAGRSINPRTDWDEWKRLLRRAGLRDGRLHDARHTAATVLLLLGVNERSIMAVMGWSDTTMTRRYVHVVEPVRKDIAQRLDNLLWSDGRARPNGPETADARTRAEPASK
jgi:integrase